MSNIRNANTFYIDTEYSTSADDLLVKDIRVMAIIFTSTSTSASITLADAVTLDTKITVKIAASNTSQIFRLSENPIRFPNGIRVTNLDRGVATLILKDSGK